MRARRRRLPEPALGVGDGGARRRPREEGKDDWGGVTGEEGGAHGSGSGKKARRIGEESPEKKVGRAAAAQGRRQGGLVRSSPEKKVGRWSEPYPLASLAAVRCTGSYRLKGVGVSK